METELVNLSTDILCKLKPRLETQTSDAGPELVTYQENEAGSPHFSNHVVIGIIKALNARGEPLVEFPANPSGRPLKARTMLPIDQKDICREAVIAFDQRDPMRPIVLGLLCGRADANRGVNVELDGEKVVLNGTREIVLRCGGASITLTRAGKVLIQGEYVLTRSKGVNRVKGASVQIN